MTKTLVESHVCWSVWSYSQLITASQPGGINIIYMCGVCVCGTKLSEMYKAEGWKTWMQMGCR